MSRVEPILRPLLHDELGVRIRTMIVEGEIAPGSRINERAICERFGVSRTPVREALKVLARDGYVRLTPNRGATAAALTLADLEEAFSVMAALEALAGELAAQHATEAQIDEVLAMHRQMRLQYDTGDRPAYFALNERIHLAIAAAAGNAILEQMQRSLDGRVRRGRYQANVSQRRWDQAMREHDEIAAALIARDAARLGAILRLHLENKLASLRDALA